MNTSIKETENLISFSVRSDFISPNEHQHVFSPVALPVKIRVGVHL